MPSGRGVGEVRNSIADLLGKHDLEKVAVEPAPEPSEQSPGGKYREIIPLVS